MTLQEFKAWFDGFTENMKGAPDKAQWERIKKRVKEIDGKVVTYPVFIDRYYERPYRRYYDTSYSTCSSSLASAGASEAAVYGMSASNFESGNAMLSLGRAESQSMASV